MFSRWTSGFLQPLYLKLEQRVLLTFQLQRCLQKCLFWVVVSFFRVISSANIHHFLVLMYELHYLYKQHCPSGNSTSVCCRVCWPFVKLRSGHHSSSFAVDSGHSGPVPLISLGGSVGAALPAVVGWTAARAVDHARAAQGRHSESTSSRSSRPDSCAPPVRGASRGGAGAVREAAAPAGRAAGPPPRRPTSPGRQGVARHAVTAAGQRATRSAHTETNKGLSNEPLLGWCDLRRVRKDTSPPDRGISEGSTTPKKP